eukprot:Hpha_TRINITY_DN15423_c6_g2::TRINITY_DN15423_c6_g2_i3::g.174691::m.174691
MYDCCARWSKWIIRESDSPQEIHMKRGLTPVALALIIAYIVIMVRLSPAERTPIWNFAFTVGVFGCIQALVGALLGAKMRICVEVFILAMAAAIIGLDIFVVASGFPRCWSLVVLVLDAALVFDVHRPIPFVLALTTLWLVVERTEAVLRLGLYDVFAPSGSAAVPDICHCESPPCSIGADNAVNGFISFAAVLLTDFYLTRGFATDLHLQVRRMEAAIAVSAEIASSLAKYDIDKAESVISRGGDVPEELLASFRALLFNLSSYKPYLPHSCLVVPEGPLDTPTDVNRDREEAFVMLDPVQSFTAGTPVHSLSDEGSVDSPGLAGLECSPRASVKWHRPSSTRDLRAEARRARVSLVAGNMCSYLSSTDLEGQANEEWIARDVELWCCSVAEARGVVGLIGGDRRYASFNARQGCGEHARAAVGVLSSRGKGNGSFRANDRASLECPLWSGCVVTGQAVCGDFGSASLLQFMVLGGLASSLHPLERVAAQWGITVLADEEAYSSACYKWEAELLGAVFMAKRREGALRLYSMGARRKSGAEAPHEEWMYAIANLPEGQHTIANEEKEKAIRAGISLDLERTSARETRPEGVVLWQVQEVGLRPC